MPAEKNNQRPFVELFDVADGLPALTVAGRLYVGTVGTEARRVVCATLRADGDLVVAATLDKTVLVLRRGGPNAPFEQQAQHKILKRATALALSPCGQRVLLADAFGDVYKLPLDASVDLHEDEHAESARALGHFSTVTALAFAADGQTVVTGDRDARLRFSRWPLTHVVEAFGLGHSEAVTGVRALPGGGWLSSAADGTIRLWRADGACASKFAVVAAATLGDTDAHTGTHDADHGPAVVVGLHVLENDRDAAVFAVVGGQALRYVNGVASGGLREGGVLARFDGAISGVCVRKDNVWVSVGGRAETVRLRTARDGETGRLRVTERVVEAIAVVPEEDGEQGNQVKQDTAGEKTTKEKKESDGDGDGDGDGDKLADGQFAWLARQRKKDMVENWKGKKRTHVAV